MYMDKRINRKTALIFWLLTLGYMGIIYSLSSMNDLFLPRISNNFDKVIHMCAYIPLAFLIYLSMDRSGLRRYVFVLAFFAASLYGITDELHQSTVPGRDPAVGDFLADSVGAFLGSLGASFTKS
jgi:VanZ family protein